MKRWIVVVVALGLGSSACVEKSSTKEKPAPAPTRTPTAPAPSPPVAKAKPPVPPPPTKPREASALCKQLLPASVIEAVIGMKGFKPTPKGVARLRGGNAQCDYWIPQAGGVKGPPKASIGMRLDCSPTHMKRERLLAALEGVNKKGDFEKVGDWLYKKGNKLHSMWAWSKRPVCMISITTGGVLERRVDALVKHVISKLTPTNAPR